MLGCRHFARMFSLRLGWHKLKLLANVVGSKTDKVFEIRLKHSTIFAIVNIFWPLQIWLNMIQVSNQQHVLCSLSMIRSMYSVVSGVQSLKASPCFSLMFHRYPRAAMEAPFEASDWDGQKTATGRNSKRGDDGGFGIQFRHCMENSCSKCWIYRRRI
jgi:hypothetical protein